MPTDGSKLSQMAVLAAIQLAAMSGANLVALHVYPKFAGGPYGTVGTAKDIIAEAHAQEHESEAGKLFADIKTLANAAGVELDCALVESDDIYRQIIAVAKRRKCDLICMASHGRRGLSAVVLGSETQKVLTHSSIPVMVVR